MAKQKLSPKAAAAKTNTNKLALSSRLVEGIRQATSRAEARAVSSSSATTTQSSNNDKNIPTNSMKYGGGTTRQPNVRISAHIFDD